MENTAEMFNQQLYEAVHSIERRWRDLDETVGEGEVIPSGIATVDGVYGGWRTSKITLLSGGDKQLCLLAALKHIVWEMMDAEAVGEKASPALILTRRKTDEVVLGLVSLMSAIPLARLSAGWLTGKDWPCLEKAFSRLKGHPIAVLSYPRFCFVDGLSQFVDKLSGPDYALRSIIIDTEGRPVGEELLGLAVSECMTTLHSIAEQHKCAVLIVSPLGMFWDDAVRVFREGVDQEFEVKKAYWADSDLWLKTDFWLTCREPPNRKSRTNPIQVRIPKKPNTASGGT